MKKYNQAPLPFQGQKRRLMRHFVDTLDKIPNGATVIDLFGGSGLLSHNVKFYRPDLHVVYNDFDNYSQRLANVSKTNALLARIRKLVGEAADDKRLPVETKESILNLIENETGFVDYLTLSASLLFSGKFAQSIDVFRKEHFYNCIKKTDYDCSGYLDGVDIQRKDYRDLYADYASTTNVIFLVDPPYLSTNCSSYEGGKYWRLTDYLDVLNVLNAANYYYFTSEKSQIVELCEWMSKVSNYPNPFAVAYSKAITNTVNYSSSYKDIMLYKLN